VASSLHAFTPAPTEPKPGMGLELRSPSQDSEDSAAGPGKSRPDAQGLRLGERPGVRSAPGVGPPTRTRPVEPLARDPVQSRVRGEAGGAGRVRLRPTPPAALSRRAYTSTRGGPFKPSRPLGRGGRRKSAIGEDGSRPRRPFSDRDTERGEACGQPLPSSRFVPQMLGAAGGSGQSGA
jgi:hypothetical protein